MLKSKLPIKMVIQPLQDKNKNFSKKKDFLRDPNADLFINISSTILPVHRSQLQLIPYFQSIPKNEKIYIIHEPVNLTVFEKILGYYYGETIVIESLQELEQYLVTCQFLYIAVIPNSIQKQLLTKPFRSEIQLFILLQISYSYNLADLFSFCLKKLEEQEFQQINYNKFDFMYIDFKLFQIVIRRHHRMKKVEHKIKGIDDEAIEETIKLYCKLHKFVPEIESKLLRKYVNVKEKQNDMNNITKGRTISSERDTSSINIINHFAKKSQRELNFEEFNGQLKIPQISQKRQRKYSDDREAMKGQTSTDEGTKLCASARIKEKSRNPLAEQIKINEEPDEDNFAIEEFQSPEIRINPNKQNTPRFDDSIHEQAHQKNDHPSDKCINILKVPFLKNEMEEKFSCELSADPDQLMDKVSELLDHYKSAFEFHENNLLTIRKKFAVRSGTIDVDQDRRFSAGPCDAPYRNEALLGISARLANTADIARKACKKGRNYGLKK